MRRIPRRRVLLLALIPVLAVTAACSSPTSKATSQPGPTHAVSTTAPAGTHEFVSKRYHFALTLPKDWSGVDAQQSWDGQALQGTDSPVFADFTDRASHRAFTIGAAPAAKGAQLAAWRTAIVRGTNPACTDPRSAKTTTLGGEPSLTWTATCPGVNPVKFAVVHGGRGYIALFEADGRSMKAADLRVFDSIRQSFRFTN
jgi:hypothetical protein